MPSDTLVHPARELNDLFRAAKYTELIDRCRDNLQHVRESENNHDDLICALCDFWRVLTENGDLSAALELAKEALELVRMRSGESSEEYARHLHNVGYLHLLLDHDDEARQLIEQARTIVQSLPEREQDGSAAILIGLAHLHSKLKDYAAAERLLIEAIRQRVHSFGWMHPRHAMALLQLARVYRCQKRYAVAEKVIRKALRIHESTESIDSATIVRYDRNLIKCDSPDYAVMLSFLGTLRHDQNDLNGARKCREDALAILRRIRPDGHFETERVKRKLVELEAENGTEEE